MGTGKTWPSVGNNKGTVGHNDLPKEGQEGGVWGNHKGLKDKYFLKKSQGNHPVTKK